MLYCLVFLIFVSCHGKIEFPEQYSVEFTGYYFYELPWSGKIYFDAVEKMGRYDTTVTIQNRTLPWTDIRRYDLDQKMQYNECWWVKQCMESEIIGELDNFEIPDNSTMENTTIHGQNVMMFEWKDDEGDQEVWWVARGNCKDHGDYYYPLQHYEEVIGLKMLMTFDNFVIGQPDPSLFEDYEKWSCTTQEIKDCPPLQ